MLWFVGLLWLGQPVDVVRFEAVGGAGWVLAWGDAGWLWLDGRSPLRGRVDRDPSELTLDVEGPGVRAWLVGGAPGWSGVVRLTPPPPMADTTLANRSSPVNSNVSRRCPWSPTASVEPP